MGFKLVDKVLSTTMKIISDTEVKNYKVWVTVKLWELLCGGQNPVHHHEKLGRESCFSCYRQSHRHAMDMGIGSCERGCQTL